MIGEGNQPRAGTLSPNRANPQILSGRRTDLVAPPIWMECISHASFDHRVCCCGNCEQRRGVSADTGSSDQ
jgi:hypothetical protein